VTRLEVALAELADAIRAEVRAELEATSAAPDRLVSVDDAAVALGIGRTSVYTAMAAGRLRSVKVGRRRLVPSSALRELAGSDA
jgi:excisionase family DNA binding protein